MQSRLRTILLGGAILAFTLAVSAIGFWKYSHYRYGGMDLAIYTNVLHQLSFSPSLGEGERLVPRSPEGEVGEGVGAGGSWGWGNWFSSIQGSSYLGDHVEPVLLFLIPFFRLWPDPRLLLILQALALGLTAIPIFSLLSLVVRRGKTVSAMRDAVRPHDSAEASCQLPEAQHGETQTDTGSVVLSERERAKDPLHLTSGFFGPSGLRMMARRPTPERLVRRAAPERKLARHGPTLLSLLWLFNPLLWNAALFEFHALAFAPLFLLSAAYAYLRRKFWWFLFWSLLSLSVREDVTLIVAMFGVVAVVDRWRDVFSSSRVSPLPPQWRGSDSSREAKRAKWERGWAWIAAPILLGLAWFLIATRIAAAYSPSGAYKFLVYYGWLVPRSLGEGGLRAVGEYAASVLRHVASIGNLDMALGLLLPFLFLPLLRPRWLLLALPPLLQILLAEPGGSNVVVELHYALLFLPALALAAIEALKTISPPLLEGELEGVRLRKWFASRFPLPRQFAIALAIATYLATAWILGPFPGIANAAIRGASTDERTRAAAYDDLLQVVQSRTSDTSGASIAAGYAALPHIAARSGAYALPYAYLGVNQYAFAPYELPDDLRFVLLDQRDALAYTVQFPSVRWSAPHAAEGPQRLRAFIAQGRFGIIAERDGIALLERGAAAATSTTNDPRYFSPDHSIRGRLIIDSLRDIVVQFD